MKKERVFIITIIILVFICLFEASYIFGNKTTISYSSNNDAELKALENFIPVYPIYLKNTAYFHTSSCGEPECDNKYYFEITTNDNIVTLKKYFDNSLSNDGWVIKNTTDSSDAFIYSALDETTDKKISANISLSKALHAMNNTITITYNINETLKKI